MNYHRPADVIGNKEIRLIHVAKSELGLPDEAYRAVLLGATGKDSSKLITFREYEKVMARFKELGFKVFYGGSKAAPPAERRKREKRAPLPPNMVEMPTPAQTGMIKALAGDIHWRTRDGLAGFCWARFGWTRPRTKRDASRLIEALKSMAARGAK
jgi:Bacteriophage Mu, GemA protein